MSKLGSGLRADAMIAQFAEFSECLVRSKAKAGS